MPSRRKPALLGSSRWLWQRPNYIVLGLACPPTRGSKIPSSSNAGPQRHELIPLIKRPMHIEQAKSCINRHAGRTSSKGWVGLVMADLFNYTRSWALSLNREGQLCTWDRSYLSLIHFSWNLDQPRLNIIYSIAGRRSRSLWTGKRSWVRFSQADRINYDSSRRSLTVSGSYSQQSPRFEQRHLKSKRPTLSLLTRWIKRGRMCRQDDSLISRWWNRIVEGNEELWGIRTLDWALKESTVFIAHDQYWNRPPIRRSCWSCGGLQWEGVLNNLLHLAHSLNKSSRIWARLTQAHSLDRSYGEWDSGPYPRCMNCRARGPMAPPSAQLRYVPEKTAWHCLWSIRVGQTSSGNTSAEIAAWGPVRVSERAALQSQKSPSASMQQSPAAGGWGEGTEEARYADTWHRSSWKNAVTGWDVGQGPGAGAGRRKVPGHRGRRHQQNALFKLRPEAVARSRPSLGAGCG